MNISAERKKLHHPARIAIAGLAFFYFLTNCALLHATETNFWKERHRNIELARMPEAPPLLNRSVNSSLSVPVIPAFSLAQQLRLSPEVVSLRMLSNHVSAPTLLHIQDLHGDPTAQDSIARMVKKIGPNLSALAVEGAFRPADLSGFERFSDQESIHTATKFLLDRGEISGALFAALNSPTHLSLVGIDDPELYDAHVRAYRNSRQFNADVPAKLSALTIDLEKEKSRNLNPALRRLETVVDDYREGKQPLTSYAQEMARRTASVPPTIQEFLEAQLLEKSLNQTRANQERQQLREELERLARNGRVGNFYAVPPDSFSTPAGFDRFLQSEKINPQPFSELRKEIQYVAITNNLDGERLMADLQSLLDQARRSLYQSENEKSIVQQADAVYLTKRLVDFSLSSSEWDRYAALLPKVGGTIGDVLRGPSFNSCREFYELARARDRAMSKRVLEIAKKTQRGTIVLVTGGFHSTGIDAALSRSGFNVINVTPRGGTGMAPATTLSQMASASPFETVLGHRALFLSFLQSDYLMRAAIQTSAKFPDSQKVFHQLLPDVPASLTRNGTALELASSNGIFDGDQQPDGSITWHPKTTTSEHLKFWRRWKVETALTFLLAIGFPGWTAPPVKPDLPFPSPAEWSTPMTATNDSRHSWIEWFNDPQLESLIQTALARNPLIAVAAARVEQASAISRKVGATRWPSISVGADASVPPNHQDGYDKSLDLSVVANWEIDVWHRVRSLRQQASLEQWAKADLLEAERQALASEVARAYFAAIGMNRQTVLQRQRVENFADVVKEMGRLVDAGYKSMDQLNRAKADLKVAEEEFQRLEEIEKESIRALEVLEGVEPAGQLEVPNEIHTVAPAMKVGIPSDILKSRWDIQVALKNFLAAVKGTAAANAARWPRLSLTADAETWSSSTSTMANLNNSLWKIGANLMAPILDWGKKLADLAFANAQQKEAAANFKNVVIHAFQECENGLSNAQSLERRETLLTEALAESNKALKSAQTKFENGAGNNLSVDQARDTVIDTESRLARVKTERLVNYVNLYSALGGDQRIVSTNSPHESSQFRLGKNLTPYFVWSSVLFAVSLLPVAGNATAAEIISKGIKVTPSQAALPLSNAWIFWPLLAGAIFIGTGLTYVAWIKLTDWVKTQDWSGFSPTQQSTTETDKGGKKDKTLGLGKEGRLEYKYLIPEELVPEFIHELIHVWGMIPDEYDHFFLDGKEISFQEAWERRFVGIEVRPYAITSLYFENRNPNNHRYFFTMMEREFQHPKRAKVRLRWYPDRIKTLLEKIENGEITPENFADELFTFHAEVKRRYGEGFRKLRVEILMKYLEEFASGRFFFNFLPSDPGAPTSKVFRNRESAGKWTFYRNQWKVEGYEWILYDRVALTKGKLRINADLRVRDSIHPRGLRLLNPKTGLPNFPKETDTHLNYPGQAVLEIKFEGNAPEMVSEFVRQHGLIPMGVSKVVDAHNKRRNERFDQVDSIGVVHDPENPEKYKYFGTEWSFENIFPYDERFDAPEQGIFLPRDKEHEAAEPDEEGEEAFNDPSQLNSFVLPILFAPVLLGTIEVGTYSPQTGSNSGLLLFGLLAASTAMLVQPVWKKFIHLSKFSSRRLLISSLAVIALFGLSQLAGAAPADFGLHAIRSVSPTEWLRSLNNLLPLYHEISNAFLIGMIFAYAYKWTQEGPSYDKKFATAVVVFPIAVSTIVFTLINAPNAVFITVGIIGIAGMLNFRTILRATLDMMYIAAGVAAGVALGTSYYKGAWIFAIAFFLVLGFLHSVEFGTQNRVNCNISFKWSGSREDLAKFEYEVLEQLCEPTGPRQDNKGYIRTSDGRDDHGVLNVTYRLRLKDPIHPDKAYRYIEDYAINGVKVVSGLASFVPPQARGWVLTFIRSVLRLGGMSLKNGNGHRQIIDIRAPLDLRIYHTLLRISPPLIFVAVLASNLLTITSRSIVDKAIPGEIQSVHAQFTSPWDGQVTDVIQLPANRFVKKGTPVVTIRSMTPEQYTNQLNLLSARLKVEERQDLLRYNELWINWQKALVSLKEEEPLYAGDALEYARLQGLAATGTVPQREVEQAKAKMDSSKARIDQYRILTEKAQKDYEGNGVQVDTLMAAQVRALNDNYQHVIEMPFDGNLTISPSIVPGLPVFKDKTELFEATDPHLKQIETYLLSPINWKPRVGEVVEIIPRDFNLPATYSTVYSVDREMSRVNNDLQRGQLGGLLYPQQLTKTPMGLRVLISVPEDLAKEEIPGALVDVNFTGRAALRVESPPISQPENKVEQKPITPPASTNEVAAPKASNEPQVVRPVVEQSSTNLTDHPIGRLSGRPVTISSFGKFSFDRTHTQNISSLTYSPNRLAIFMGDHDSGFVTVVGPEGNFIDSIDISGLASESARTVGQVGVEAMTWIGGNQFALVLENQKEIILTDLHPGKRPPQRFEAAVLPFPDNLPSVSGIAVDVERGSLFLASNSGGKLQIFEARLNLLDKKIQIVNHFDLSGRGLGSITEISPLPTNLRDQDFALTILDGQNQKLFVWTPSSDSLSRESLDISRLNLSDPEGMVVTPDAIMVSANNKGRATTSNDYSILKIGKAPADENSSSSGASMGLLTFFHSLMAYLNRAISPATRLIWVPIVTQDDIKDIGVLKQRLPSALNSHVLITILGSDPNLKAGVLKMNSGFNIVDGAGSVEADGSIDVDRLFEEVARTNAGANRHDFLASVIIDLANKRGGTLSTVFSRPDLVKMSSFLAERNTYLVPFLGILIPITYQSLRYRLWKLTAALRYA